MSEKHQYKKLNEYRVRRVISIFPWICVPGFESDYHWTGRWFSFVEIKEQKIKERYVDFDGGWTQQNYWTPWEYSWRIVKILK